MHWNSWRGCEQSVWRAFFGQRLCWSRLLAQALPSVLRSVLVLVIDVHVEQNSKVSQWNWGILGVWSRFWRTTAGFLKYMLDLFLMCLLCSGSVSHCQAVNFALGDEPDSCIFLLSSVPRNKVERRESKTARNALPLHHGGLRSRHSRRNAGVHSCQHSVTQRITGNSRTYRHIRQKFCNQSVIIVIMITYPDMSWHVLTCSDLIIVVFSMLAAFIDLEDVKHNGWQLLAAYNVQCWPWFLVNFCQPLVTLCVFCAVVILWISLTHGRSHGMSHAISCMYYIAESY